MNTVLLFVNSLSEARDRRVDKRGFEVQAELNRFQSESWITVGSKEGASSLLLYLRGTMERLNPGFHACRPDIVFSVPNVRCAQRELTAR